MTLPARPDVLVLSGATAQNYARIGGVLFLLSIVAGGFGEFFAPSQIIVPGSATATAHNIAAANLLYRLGFASYLVEALCDLALTLVFFVLLRPVSPSLALLVAFIRIVSTATFAFSELFYFAPTLILSGAEYLKTFSPEQLQTLALLSFRIYGLGAGVFMVFYGVAQILLGYLMFRSDYLPKALGTLLALGGLGFVARSFALVLAPTYASQFLLLPTVLAGVLLTGWLLVRGIDVRQWDARAAHA